MKCFIDTSAFYALEDAGDRNHQEARMIQKAFAEERPVFYTTNHVLDECVTLIGSRLGPANAVRFANVMLASRLLRIIRSDEVLEQAGLALYGKYGDGRISFTDCLGFAAMRALDIHFAFAFDRHFERAGFELVRSR